MNYQCIIWLFIALVFLILEIGHPGLFLFLSFFCGSLLALCASLFNFVFLEQLIAMVIGTGISLLVLGVFLRNTKQLNLYNEPKTNMYALQGKRGYVTKAITALNMGEVKIEREFWAARSVHQQNISEGALIEVVQVSGCHCLVKIIN